MSASFQSISSSTTPSSTIKQDQLSLSNTNPPNKTSTTSVKMKFASVATFLALFAATQACAIKSCTEENGGGICTDFKDQLDGGCHFAGDALVLKSFVWSGDDCAPSAKHICVWETGVCNGARHTVQPVGLRPEGDVYNWTGWPTARSWKFMNNRSC